jgi:hypothetical protein
MVVSSRGGQAFEAQPHTWRLTAYAEIGQPHPSVLVSEPSG